MRFCLLQLVNNFSVEGFNELQEYCDSLEQSAVTYRY